ncbi:MAG: hypothetical protein GAK37_03070 [Pseudomonas sp.]|nr:MAG: hypothetical protein GAK37_03070 [Pseudomonas sp.]
MRKIFLACPYSHTEPAVVHERFVHCNQVAASIVEAGHAVFSQVSMSNPINQAFTGKDAAAIGKLWAPVDAVFMELLDELIVLDLPGWELSGGIKREIEFFKNKGRRVSLWSQVSAEFI